MVKTGNQRSGGGRKGSGGLPWPPVTALVVSMLVHAVAAAALLVTTEIPAPPPAPAPEPQAIALMVEMVPEETVSSEKPQEVREGEADATEEAAAAPEANEAEDVSQTQPVEDLVPVETLPQTIPLPVRRPRPERREVEEKHPDKTTVAKARGIADLPDPDIETADQPGKEGEGNPLAASEMTRGVVRNTPAAERWQARLVAHLQRRKRYPQRALSRRLEGIVHVRFNVGTDGAVMLPEIAQSSGIADLDQEVLDLVERASPMPRPPPGVNSFVTVPVSFNIKG